MNAIILRLLQVLFWGTVAAAVLIIITHWPSRLDLQVALRYLRSRRSSRLLSLITVIAVGGVTVGVMALVFILGIMNGLQNDLREKILVVNPHLRVTTYGEGLRLDDWPAVLARVRRTPGVEAAAPFVLTQGLISAGHDYAEGVAVVGVEADTGSRAVTSLPRHFTKGDLSFRTTQPGVDGGVAIGVRLASKLTVYPGDVVTLVAPAGTQYNRSLGAVIPKYRRYEVTGLFETGMYDYDNSYVAMRRDVAQDFAGLGSAVTGLDVRLTDPGRASEFGTALEAQLGYPYHTIDWQSQNRSLFSALKLEKLGMGLIVFLICVVAAFNVVGTLTMVVRDKTREIGILLAMGMRRASIRKIFLAQGILVGLLGTGLGAVLGLILGASVNRGHLVPIDPSIYFIDHLPVHTEPLDALVVVAASLVIATLAPLYPSVQAARLDPVTAIRYE
ncbi:MAG TPA: FtsX-like permease family protein [Gemmatimonadales bacterium]|jgi:lipoprotein-releasing system permease protein|nr:FtsX-like permease family protein [Gemmatimonadales bacterium]